MSNESKLSDQIFAGVLSSLRILGLVMGYDIMTEILETHMTLQTLLIAVGLMVNALQVFMNVPRIAPQIEDPAKGLTDEISETSPFVPKVASSKEIGRT